MILIIKNTQKAIDFCVFFNNLNLNFDFLKLLFANEEYITTDIVSQPWVFEWLNELSL